MDRATTLAIATGSGCVWYTYLHIAGRQVASEAGRSLVRWIIGQLTGDSIIEEAFLSFFLRIFWLGGLVLLFDQYPQIWVLCQRLVVLLISLGSVLLTWGQLLTELC